MLLFQNHPSKIIKISWKIKKNIGSQWPHTFRTKLITISVPLFPKVMNIFNLPGHNLHNSPNSYKKKLKKLHQIIFHTFFFVRVSNRPTLHLLLLTYFSFYLHTIITKVQCPLLTIRYAVSHDILSIIKQTRIEKAEISCRRFTECTHTCVKYS